MGDYSQAAEFYDVLYSGQKDYGAEVDRLADWIRAGSPTATSVLDVGCGTGVHARCLIDAGFSVDGVDLEPAFVEIASAKCPEANFSVGDMRTLDLSNRYDAVVCLFSAIGYVRDEAALFGTIARMAAHREPGGVVLVDPWFEPGDLADGWISTTVGRGDGVTVYRMSRTVLIGSVSRLEFEYLIGTAEGIERRSEVHEPGVFTQDEMEASFRAAGLTVERLPKLVRTRGIYVGRGTRDPL